MIEFFGTLVPEWYGFLVVFFCDFSYYNFYCWILSFCCGVW